MTPGVRTRRLLFPVDIHPGSQIAKCGALRFTEQPMIPHGTILASQDSYHTPADRRRSFLPPTLAFYLEAIGIVFRSSHRAKRGRYGDREWVDSSLDVINALEHAGCNFHIEGMDGIRALAGPAVFVANHMSTLETFVLPALINPVRRCTFVIKPSLVDYPCSST